MPVGTCDPASRGLAYDTTTMSRGNGLVTIVFRTGWDGRSTRDQRTYTVKSGDTLASIATQFSATQAELQLWNGMSGTTVTPGQVLIVWPGGCDGPLVNGTGGGNNWAVQVTNNDTASWWVHTKGKRGQPRDYEFTAGSVTQFTRQQASSNGYDSYADFAELILDQSPTPPAALRKGG